MLPTSLDKARLLLGVVLGGHPLCPKELVLSQYRAVRGKHPLK